MIHLFFILASFEGRAWLWLQYATLPAAVRGLASTVLPQSVTLALRPDIRRKCSCTMPRRQRWRAPHTDIDTYDHVLEDGLKQSAAIAASFMYNLAMRDEKLPRKPLPWN